MLPVFPGGSNPRFINALLYHAAAALVSFLSKKAQEPPALFQNNSYFYTLSAFDETRLDIAVPVTQGPILYQPLKFFPLYHYASSPRGGHPVAVLF